ncbi:hypothetical protein Tcan_00822, partial [Toxocara canis]
KYRTKPNSNSIKTNKYFYLLAPFILQSKCAGTIITNQRRSILDGKWERKPSSPTSRTITIKMRFWWPLGNKFASQPRPHFTRHYITNPHQGIEKKLPHKKA